MCDFPAYQRKDVWQGLTVTDARAVALAKRSRVCTSNGVISDTPGSIVGQIACKPPVVTKFKKGSLSTYATCTVIYQCPAYKATCKASGGPSKKAKRE